MKKARANTNDYWDKKLLEVEEKDPNRWRHTGYKKMYIEGESSSESDRESFRYSRVHKIIHMLFSLFLFDFLNCDPDDSHTITDYTLFALALISNI